MNNRQLPIYSREAKTGDIGVRLVEAIIADNFGWIFREQEQQKDFGIDAHIEVLTSTGLATGKLIALQIKCGQSYFKNRNEFGFVYRGDNKHLSYFLNYSTPVLIVLCNPEEKKCWWCHIKLSETDKAGNSWSITIPFHQVLSTDSLSILASIAGKLEDFTPATNEHWDNIELLDRAWKFLHIVVPREDIEADRIDRITTIFNILTEHR